MSDSEKLEKARREVERLRAAWPAEFNDGARCAFMGKYNGARELGGYPKGFHDWPLDRRNAWYAGWNCGDIDREKFEAEAQK